MKKVNINLNKSDNSRGKLLLFIRLAIVFIMAFALGNYSVSETYDLIISEEYVSSFVSLDARSFFENVFSASAIEFCLLLLVSGSALTFFCPFAAHALTTVGGFIYGARFAFLASSFTNSTNFICLLFSGVFAIIYTYWATYTVKANRCFLSHIGKGFKGSYFFISQDFKRFLFQFIKILTLFALTRILFIFLLLI